MLEPSTSRMVTAIQAALAPRAEVQAALLFGSHARGRARADSDVDIALLLTDEGRACERRVLLRSLVEALSTQLAADRLDLVLLDDAPPALAFQVLKYGLVAFERDAVALHRFRVRTYSAHADYEPVERTFREATRRRALEESRRG